MQNLKENWQGIWQILTEPTFLDLKYKQISEKAVKLGSFI